LLCNIWNFNFFISFMFSIFRGGGGRGRRWHEDGRRTKKHNSINDYISCANFLVEREIVHQNKLAGWGYSAGGLLVASAINCCPDLFRAAVLKVHCSSTSTTTFCMYIMVLHKTYLAKKHLLRLSPCLATIIYLILLAYWKNLV